MAKQYAVVHIEKGKGSGGALGNHIDRTEGKEYSYKHSEPEKKHLNQNFELNKYSSMPLAKAISQRIQDGYTSKRKINDNAVTHLKIVLTGSHEKMKEIEGNHEKLKQWVVENKKFLEEKYGKENIVRFTLHRDERTPHLHAVVVPLTPDGRLSAFEVIGNKTKLKELQNDYAKKMNPFGLERGLENTGIKHEDAKAYYARMEQANDIAKKTDIKADKNLLGVYKSESVEELEKSVKTLKSALKSKELIIESNQKRFEDIHERSEAINKTNKVLQTNLKTIFGEEEVYKREQSKAIEKARVQLTNAFEKEVRYKFSLKFNNEEERNTFVSSQLQKIAKEQAVPNGLLQQAVKNKEFVNKLFEKVTQREQSQNRGQNRGFSR